MTVQTSPCGSVRQQEADVWLRAFCRQLRANGGHTGVDFKLPGAAIRFGLSETFDRTYF